MTNRDTFEELRKLTDGPVKKFKLIKTFGKALKDYGLDDPRVLSCSELEDVISFLLTD